MIVGSILLVLVAAGLLVTGLVLGSDEFFYSSIVGSVIAALALIVGVRQAAAIQAEDDDFDVRPGAPPDLTEAVFAARPVEFASVSGARVPRQQAGADFAADSDAVPAADAEGDEIPPDEPPAQQVTEAEAALVARLGSEVLVVDGRPRYHIPACLHLLGREYERLPVGEAVGLGFTPCGHCKPDRVLLAGAPGV